MRDTENLLYDHSYEKGISGFSAFQEFFRFRVAQSVDMNCIITHYHNNTIFEVDNYGWELKYFLRITSILICCIFNILKMQTIFMIIIGHQIIMEKKKRWKINSYSILRYDSISIYVLRKSAIYISSNCFWGYHM